MFGQVASGGEVARRRAIGRVGPHSQQVRDKGPDFRAHLGGQCAKRLSTGVEAFGRGALGKNDLVRFEQDVMIGDHSAAVHHPRLAAWRATFGEAFTAKVCHPDRLRAGDVVHDFIAFTTQQPRARSTLETLPDSSLSLPDLAMMREVHARIMEMEGGEAPGMDLARRQIGWHMAPILGRRHGELDVPPADRLAMPRPLAQRVAEHFREDAAAMDADFFQGAPLTKALDEAVEGAIPQRQSLDAESYFDAAELARIRAWAEFIGRIAIADPQAFFWASMPPEERAAHMERARAVDGTLTDDDLREDTAEGPVLSRIKDKLR